MKSPEAFLPVAGVAVLIVVLAALFRLVPSASRRRLGRSVVLFGLYLALTLIEFGISQSRLPELVKGFDLARDLLGVLLLINLAAVVLFDLLLAVSRWRYPHILRDLTVGAAYLMAVVWLMHRAGLNLTSIVATSAVVTAVIGLSLQATLGNIVGGLALQVDETIREGDWIELENKTQGQVRKIRWRHTELETRDWDTLIVPNGQLMTQTIKVLGKRDGRSGVGHRMLIQFCVDYRYSPTEVIRVVEEALNAAPIAGVANHPEPHCLCHDLAREQRDGYVIYSVRYWLLDLLRDDPTSSLVRERIFTALRRAEIPLAIPAAALFLSQRHGEPLEDQLLRARDEKLAALERVDLFQVLDEAERRTLADAARRVPFADGEVIARQGSSADSLYVLSKGTVDVRVLTADGERQVATLSAPDFFGEMALMTGEPREASVRALGEVECLCVEKRDLEALLKHRPELAEKLSSTLAARRVELEAARGGDAGVSREQRVSRESARILHGIRNFFGL